jgi:hypothetical protein
MIKAYKDAGAKYVFLHSDGDIRLVLDMLVDAGIDGLNPVERRAHMNIAELRRLIPAPGGCATQTETHSPAKRRSTAPGRSSVRRVATR